MGWWAPVLLSLFGESRLSIQPLQRLCLGAASGSEEFEFGELGLPPDYLPCQGVSLSQNRLLLAAIVSSVVVAENSFQ